MLKGKHILLGISGGIAAYKSALLVRDFVKAGADVQVVMTRNATQFVTPLTISTLSKREVIVEMFPSDAREPVAQWTKHIDLALWADIMLIAPATANTIAKIAHGYADDFLSTLVLALRCPLAVAPAMDVDMYLNETTQENIGTLRETGCHVINPEEGELASGLTGPGRLPEPSTLFAFTESVLDKAPGDLKGKRVLVTAGPTHEPIDPVRYVGNHSSGKMGFALANVAAQRGAEVTLICGPVSIKTPRNTRRINVQRAEEMQSAVEREYETSDIVIMAAAVADFSPVQASTSKIKRETLAEDRLILELKKNRDILKSLGSNKKHQFLVGFALETDNGVENAMKKLQSKNLDMIVLNNPGEKGAGFGTDTNIVTVITPDGAVESLPKQSKFDVAHDIMNRVVKRMQ